MWTPEALSSTRNKYLTTRSSYEVGSNNGIGVFNENIVTFWGTKLPGFVWAQKMCLKKCSFKELLKSWQVCPRGYKSPWGYKSGGNHPQIRLSWNQNMSESQCSCIFQEPMNRGKYAYMSFFVRYGLGKSFYVFKIPPVQAENKMITVSVFLSTLQLTALLLKSFRLRLHCYTLLWDVEYIITRNEVF